MCECNPSIRSPFCNKCKPTHLSDRSKNIGMINAEKLALEIYPEEWVKNSEILGFKHDNNAQKRSIAIDTIKAIETVFFDENSAKNVMYAFYRREHHKEPKVDEVEDLTCHMLTAFMAIDMYRNKVEQ